MDRTDEILRILNRIEEQINETHSLKERVSKLEIWQSWIKGAWAAITGVFVLFGWGRFGK